MKMRKSTSKILSLVLVLSFVFSLSAVTASAADTNEQDELVTFILEYDKNCEVYELSDGTTVVSVSSLRQAHTQAMILKKQLHGQPQHTRTLVLQI